MVVLSWFIDSASRTDAFYRCPVTASGPWRRLRGNDDLCQQPAVTQAGFNPGQTPASPRSEVTGAVRGSPGPQVEARRRSRRVGRGGGGSASPARRRRRAGHGGGAGGGLRGGGGVRRRAAAPHCLPGAAAGEAGRRRAGAAAAELAGAGRAAHRSLCEPLQALFSLFRGWFGLALFYLIAWGCFGFFFPPPARNIIPGRAGGVAGGRAEEGPGPACVCRARRGPGAAAAPVFAGVPVPGRDPPGSGAGRGSAAPPEVCR